MFHCSLDELNITTDGDGENDIGNNIDKVSSFSLKLTREDNTDSDDVNDNVKDNEFYIWDY